MAGEAQDGAIWPIPAFYFNVSIPNIDTEMAFQEVSGLDSDHDIIEYRAGNSPTFSTVKMPGLKKGSDVTMKKGLFVNDARLMEYFQQITMNTIERQDIVITLLDEQQAVQFTWTLRNAFPMKLTGPSLNAQASEIAIEEITFAHEGITFGLAG